MKTDLNVSRKVLTELCELMRKRETYCDMVVALHLERIANDIAKAINEQPPLPEVVMLFIGAGRKIDAIKALRDHKEMSLVDAKNLVESKMMALAGLLVGGKSQGETE